MRSLKNTSLLTVAVRLTREQREYLDRCASLRDCTASGLIGALARQIADDQLVLAVLDDNSGPLRHPSGRKVRAKSAPSPASGGSVLPPAELMPPAQHSAPTEHA